MPEPKEHALLVDMVASGDRPSIQILGMVGGQSLKKSGIAVFMVDVFGRVRLMPPEAVEIKAQPLIPDEELNQMAEEEAILVMTQEGRPDDDIVAYLKRRADGSQSL